MKRHGINARSATGNSSAHGRNVVRAAASSNPLSNSVRYLLGILMGLLIASLLIAPPTTVSTAEPQFAVIMKYRQMIERDDLIIDHMLDGTWDRSKLIRCEFVKDVPWTGRVVWTSWQDE